jgi:hypothetical protein
VRGSARSSPPSGPRFIVDLHANRTVQQGFGIEDVIDLWVFHHAVDMNARRGIELATDEGCADRDILFDLLPVVLGNFSDDP